jgi:hypothetical protein
MTELYILTFTVDDEKRDVVDLSQIRIFDNFHEAYKALNEIKGTFRHVTNDTFRLEKFKKNPETLEYEMTGECIPI